MLNNVYSVEAGAHY